MSAQITAITGLNEVFGAMALDIACGEPFFNYVRLSRSPSRATASQLGPGLATCTHGKSGDCLQFILNFLHGVDDDRPRLSSCE